MKNSKSINSLKIFLCFFLTILIISLLLIFIQNNLINKLENFSQIIDFKQQPGNHTNLQQMFFKWTEQVNTGDVQSFTKDPNSDTLYGIGMRHSVWSLTFDRNRGVVNGPWVGVGVPWVRFIRYYNGYVYGLGGDSGGNGINTLYRIKKGAKSWEYVPGLTNNQQVAKIATFTIFKDYIIGIGLGGGIWVQNTNNISQNSIWKYNGGSGSKFKYITAATHPDGDYLYIVNPSLQVYRIKIDPNRALDNQTYDRPWTFVAPNSVTIIQISGNYLYGIGNKSPVYRLDLTKVTDNSPGTWVQFTGGAIMDFVVADNFIYGIGLNNKIWTHPVDINQLPAIKDFPSASGCAADYNSTEPCCDQPGTNIGTQWQCPSSLPICKGYKWNVNWGTCQKKEGFENITSFKSISDAITS